MKALVKVKPGKGGMELRELERPVPGPDEVVLRVRACGVCGSDLHVYNGEMDCKTPIVPGHEFSGQIASLGSGVDCWKEGDAVVAGLHVGACGSCYWCSRGLVHLCPSKTPIGWGVDGGFAEYIRVPAWLLHRIPEGVAFRTAAVTEPLAIAVHSILERTGLGRGDRVAIIGAGPLGLLAAIVCKWAGASWTGIVGRSTRGNLRLKAAEQLDLDAVIDSSCQDPVGVVADATAGVGADVVVEAAGTEEAISLSLELLRRDGSLAALGLGPVEKIAFPWNEAMTKVCRIIFSWSSTRSSWDKALEIMQACTGYIDKLVTHELSLTEWEEGFRLLEERRAIKCVLIP